MKDKKRFGWKLKAALILLAVLAVAGAALGYYIRDEYQTYYSSDAREYETISVDRGSYRLVTAKKEFLGSMYVSFVVNDADTGGLIYQCPDLYLVKELESIGWEDGSDHILVHTKMKGTVRYLNTGKAWEKEE